MWTGESSGRSCTEEGRCHPRASAARADGGWGRSAEEAVAFSSAQAGIPPSHQKHPGFVLLVRSLAFSQSGSMHLWAAQQNATHATEMPHKLPHKLPHAATSCHTLPQAATRCHKLPHAATQLQISEAPCPLNPVVARVQGAAGAGDSELKPQPAMTTAGIALLEFTIPLHYSLLGQQH
jgi:hypothetical protein